MVDVIITNMRVQKFITFGDSWPAGAELQPGEKTYGELIAEKKQIEFENYSIQATAAENMLLQLQKFIGLAEFDHYQYTALFSFTGLHRFQYFTHNGAQCTNVSPTGPLPDDVVSANYYKYLHSRALDHFKFYMTTVALQGLYQKYSINDYYVLSFSRVNWATQDFTGIDRTKFYDQGNINFLDLFGCKYITNKNKYFHGNLGHPNQQGHQLIANTLTDWISCS